MIEQALIAVGGKGSRLIRDNIDVPISKSFLELKGKPLFFWHLLTLQKAGVKRLVVSGNTEKSLSGAKRVVSNLQNKKFSSIEFLQDTGFDTTCKLPYFARYYLENDFIFTFGHSLFEPAHYRNISKKKSRRVIVFSSFKPLEKVARHPVLIHGSNIKPIQSLTGISGEFNLGAPYVFGQDYLERIPELSFNTDAVIKDYSVRDKLIAVESSIPMEINTNREYQTTLPVYDSLVEKLKEPF